MALAIDGGQPVRRTFLSYGRQWIDSDDIEAVLQVLKGDFITQGPKIKEFEQALADYVGTKYAVVFSNGTAALHAACVAAEIGPGDEVITSPITFVASSNCVLYAGGKPVFADIDPVSFNIDPNEIEKLINSRTKAIIPVDFAGQPVQIEEILQIAKASNITVILDAAHSLGATVGGRKTGSHADMTMFSFHPVKSITTGEGGAIVTDDPSLYEKLTLFRTHGITRDQSAMQSTAPWYYEMHELGYNYRLTDIQAALGISQLRRLDFFIQKRQRIAQIYTEAFSDMEGVIPPLQMEDRRLSWHLYVIRLELEKFSVGRRQIFEALRAENIGVNVHYIPVYYQPYYQKLGYKRGLCPHAEQYYESAITLPIFPNMTDQDIQDVITAVQKVTKYYLK